MPHPAPRLQLLASVPPVLLLERTLLFGASTTAVTTSLCRLVVIGYYAGPSFLCFTVGWVYSTRQDTKGEKGGNKPKSQVYVLGVGAIITVCFLFSSSWGKLYTSLSVRMSCKRAVLVGAPRTPPGEQRLGGSAQTNENGSRLGRAEKNQRERAERKTGRGGILCALM